MSENRTVEWLNENHERAFPLVENNNRFFSVASVKYDLYHMLLDAVLQFETLPDQVRLEAINTSSGTLYINVTDQPAFSIANYKTASYPLTVSNTLNSRITVGEELARLPDNRAYVMSLLNLDVLIEPSVCFEISAYYRGVSSLQIDDEPADIGDIELTEGYQLTLNPTAKGFALEVGRNEGVPLGCQQMFNIISTPTVDLTESVNAEVLGYIDGVTAGNASIKLYSTFNEGAGTFVRNVDNWAIKAGIDLTFSSLHSVFKLSLITPRHAIGARHIARAVGETIKFMDNAGNVHSRVIVARALNLGPINFDLAVYLFNQDLPGSVRPAKTLPRNYLHYFRDYVISDVGPFREMRPAPMAMMSINQFQDVSIMDYSLAYLIGPNGYHMVSGLTTQPNTSPFYPFRATHGPYTPGDSSCPVMGVVDGESFVAWCLTGAGGTGPDIARTSATVNSMIATLDDSMGVNTGYQLGVIDLSRFTVYNSVSDNNTGIEDFDTTPVFNGIVLKPSSATSEAVTYVASDCEGVVSFVAGATPNKTGEAVYVEGVKHVKVYQDPSKNRIYIGLDFVEEDVKHQTLPNPPNVL